MKNMKRNAIRSVYLSAVLLIAPATEGATFNFDVIYDGVGQTEIATIDTIGGTVLVAGVDEFTLSVATEANHAWSASGSYGIIASPSIFQLTNESEQSF